MILNWYKKTYDLWTTLYYIFEPFDREKMLPLNQNLDYFITIGNKSVGVISMIPNYYLELDTYINYFYLLN